MKDKYVLRNDTRGHSDVVLGVFFDGVTVTVGGPIGVAEARELIIRPGVDPWSEENFTRIGSRFRCQYTYWGKGRGVRATARRKKAFARLLDRLCVEWNVERVRGFRRLMR